MNTRLLRKVAKHIAEEPRRYNQNYTLSTDVSADYVSDAPPCGTIACIGGWVCSLTGKSAIGRTQFNFKRAQKQLGLTFSQARRLFAYSYSESPDDSWPKKFREAYDLAGDDHAARVKVAVARIEHFIKTKGKE